MRAGVLVASLVSFSAFGAEVICQKPGGRDVNAISAAIRGDEALAASFEATSAACVHGTPECDAARLKCGTMLADTLRGQINFDEGAYLRDMLVLFSGQHYTMQTPVPAAAPLSDVSCSAESDTLKVAGMRRRQQAERRRLLLQEYPRWIAWTQGASQQCLAGAAADKQRADAAAAVAAGAAAAAEAATAAEAARQAEMKKRLEQEQRAQAELKLQQERDAQAARDRAAAERQAKEDADAKAKRDALLAADAAAVADREAGKQAARNKQAELMEAEKRRQADARLQLEQQHQAAEAAHQAKIAELQHSIELSEAEKTAAIAKSNADFEAAEAQRQADAQKQIAAAGEFDRSDERNRGAIAVHVAGGYFGLSDDGGDASGAMLGGQLTLHHGFWALAPAHGMASGVELRGTVTFLTSLGAVGSAQLLQVAPEFRYWFGRIGIGAMFEWEHLATTVETADHTTELLGLGPTISLAAVDTPDARCLFSVRWTPFFNNQWARVTGELEAGYSWFSFTLSGGALGDTSGGLSRLGWFASVGIGGRLRW